ncbi:DUF2239 family protein [Novosphingobium sp. JCM 18896]|uniref:DUF2239 family protein n=1 Tax=Novosphingobium sp. JCM 18896 TaxID=2989731 RepID=UPI00222222FC|nr:DUF2239 family protein [Novosphingobium sp. JCM 18896]MCW1430612.1 DUF2239 family protein [Novosphingobium sp. JCM 18896]
MPVTAFVENAIFARGSAEDVASQLRGLPPLERASDVLVFDDESGRQIDLPVREVEAPRGRGRPSLGVSAREVTLLPRHWEWLAGQPGGASATLRRLIEEARKRARSARECLDAAYRFLTVMAGDRPGYEEAMRALYAGDRVRFDELAEGWPEAVRDHGAALAWPEAA